MAEGRFWRGIRITAATFAIIATPQVSAARPDAFGSSVVRTVPLPDGVFLESATYTPSGKILVAYRKRASDDPRDLNLAVVADDGSGMRPFFSQRLPDRAKDNGIRYMVFPDNRRIFTGDFVVECSTSLEDCRNPALIPVVFSASVADGAHIAHRWSEIIVAPDNRHVAWTTLLADYSAVVFTGELRKEGARYVIAEPRIVSTTEAFRPDPRHPDGALPQLVRNGEVKQFVEGGTAISLAGGVTRDLANSAMLHLADGAMEAITDLPGYTETTIFSPDERLGLTMTAHFSQATDLKVLSLVPRPYTASLNMGLNMLAYTHSVTGVRKVRQGSVGPALIDIRATKTRPGYLGHDLSTSSDWVFYSPMSWHPGGKKALWMEGLRGSDSRRIQLVEIPGYRPRPPVRSRATPTAMPYASADLSIVPGLVGRSRNIDVKVYGRKSGHIAYRRTLTRIEKTYVDYSDDGRTVWSGRESLRIDPRANSTYTADLTASGAAPGRMDLTVTIGPLGGPTPARLVFEPDSAGQPQTRGYAEYRGRRLSVVGLIP